VRTPEVAQVRWGTPAARWILAATVLGSGLAFLDATSSNVALPAIGRDLGASVAGLQWTINGYTLTLAALILVGGSLADRFGRRRLFVIGTVWFAAASLLCGLAFDTQTLVVARMLQGAGGALLTPGSLAIIQSSFSSEDRGRAVGAWSGLSGIAAAAGPFVGGWLVDVASWRWIYFTNLPVAAAVVWVAVRHVPESYDPTASRSLDVPGAVLVAAGLGSLTWALIAAGEAGMSSAVLVGGIAGLAGLAGFVFVEWRSPHPMLPLSLFRSRQFTAVNLVTVAVYAGLAALFFLLMVHLQQVVGYSGLQAGLAAIPITGLLLVLSSPAGALSDRIGPRRPMTIGPLTMAAGLLLLLRVDGDADYVTDILPAVVLFGVGLSLTVAPLTATVLASADARHVGVASGVNNAVARGAGLMAVAVLPGLAGITGEAYLDPDVFLRGFRSAMLMASGLVAFGGVLAWATIRDDAVGPVEHDRDLYCAVDGPPIELSEPSPWAE
jgi:EmrB/QacA subfamily drug resistance transporter